ncbi:hypothetical protein QQ045_032739 [Rhodiola kirilowii]
MHSNMSYMSATVLLLFIITISPARAQDFFPHGLDFEPPVALSPSAFNFFNSTSHSDHICGDSGCSPLPQAAEVEVVAQTLHDSHGRPTIPDGREVLSSKGIAGIVVGLVAVAIVGIGAYYVVRTRRANLIRARPPRPLP